MSRLYDCIKRYNDTLPDNISFTFREGESYAHVSFRQLYEYLNTLSSYLAGYKGKSIAIIGNNKLEYAVCLLSVICNIGDAFLVDKELSEEDVVNVFSQKKPDLIILDDDLDFVFENYEVLKFSDVREVLKTRRDFDNDASFSGGLILHTSGTTGIPKCVRLDEQNYFGVIPELNRKWNVTSEQSCMLIIPLYHIYALVSLFHGLYAGINNIIDNKVTAPKFYIITPVPGTPFFEEVKDSKDLVNKDIYTYSPSGPAVKNSKHLTAKEIDEMYWWLYNEVYSIKNIYKRIVFCRSFLRHPFRSMFNLGVNFFYRYHIKHNIAPIII